MDCKEALSLIDADTDGELDLVAHLALAEHRRGCPACRQAAETAAARRHALRAGLTRHAAPAALRERLTGSFSAPVETPGLVLTARRAPAWWTASLAVAATLAIVVAYQAGRTRERRHDLFNEVVADHVRSLQEKHLTDVVSTDQHTVKPWFAGRLDFSPPVADLAAQGFPLVGGRLEYIGGQAGAALVFQRHKHVVNLMIWRAGESPLRRSSEEQFGYRSLAWSDSGLNFVAVSEIPKAELAAFADAFRQATR